VIQGGSESLSPELIAQRLQSLAKLKIHPREQEENQTVLARADRLYQENLGDVRQAIGTAHTRFAAALERQEPREIAREREALEATLERFSADTVQW
jgi:molecular chaperone HscC